MFFVFLSIFTSSFSLYLKSILKSTLSFFSYISGLYLHRSIYSFEVVLNSNSLTWDYGHGESCPVCNVANNDQRVFLSICKGISAHTHCSTCTRPKLNYIEKRFQRLILCTNLSLIKKVFWMKGYFGIIFLKAGLTKNIIERNFCFKSKTKMSNQ